MNIIKIIVSTIVGFLSWLIGGWTLLLAVLFTLNILDYITGLTASWMNGEISSKKGLKGIVKKVIVWVWVVVANLLYMATNQIGLDIGQVLPNAVAVLFIVNEVISIGENSHKMGVPMPAPISKALAIFKNTNEKGGE